MVRIVGAALVVARSHRLNAPGRWGAHKGRPYIDRFSADAN